MIQKPLIFCWIFILALFAAISASYPFNSAIALLDGQTVGSIRSNFADALMAIASGNATQAQSPLVQANQTISQHVCNSPICNTPGGFLRTDEADSLRMPIRDALMAIASGNATQAQSPLVQANQTLSTLLQ